MTEPASSAQLNRRLRRIIGAVAALFVVVLAAVIGYRLLLPASPFTAQNRVLDRIPWNYKPDEPYDHMINLYTWLDNDTVAYFVPDKDGKLPAVKQRVALGKTFPPEPLPGVRTSLEIIDISASPDGTGLAITGWDASDREQCQIFALNRGGESHQFALYSPNVFWLADSRSLIVFIRDFSDAQLYRLSDRRLKPLPTSPLPVLADAIDVKGIYFDYDMSSYGQITPYMTYGSVFGGMSQKRNLPIPGDLSALMLESVSPRGDRLLWRASIAQIPLVTRLFGKVMKTSPDPVNIQHWYTTDTQGANPRTVYSLAPAPDPSGYGKSLYLSPKWLPDGKRLSVVHEGALYIIPVP